MITDSLRGIKQVLYFKREPVLRNNKWNSNSMKLEIIETEIFM